MARRGTRGSHPKARGFLSRRALKQVATILSRPPREAGIAGDRWSLERIHRLLRKRFEVTLSPRYAIRRLREAGVRVKLVRAREPQLTRSKLAHLARMLRRPPSAFGLTGERWSRAHIAELIERRFHRRFTEVHAGRLARRLRRRGLGRARDRRLTRDQARTLREALKQDTKRSPSTWTRSETAALIERLFGVRYHSQSIPGLLERWRLAVVLAPAARGDARPSPQQCAHLASALTLPPSSAGIAAPRWEQRHIAQYLRSQFQLEYPTRGLYRRIQRWGVAILTPAAAGGTCALNTEQRSTLAAALSAPPASCGYSERAWSRALVARFIVERFNVHYARGSIPHVLRREGLRVRMRAAATSEGAAPVAGLDANIPSVVTEEPTVRSVPRAPVMSRPTFGLHGATSGSVSGADQTE